VITVINRDSRDTTFGKDYDSRHRVPVPQAIEPSPLAIREPFMNKVEISHSSSQYCPCSFYVECDGRKSRYFEVFVLFSEIIVSL
jgi:hypothetical protein